MNFVDCLLFHKALTEIPSNTNSFGATVYPQRVPVNPAILENEQISIAQVLAPSISKIDLGSVGSVINYS